MQLNLFSKFSENLKCPVSLDLLTSAVTLTPCGHKVNEVIAKKIFQGMSLLSGCVIEKKPCPVCRKPVNAYYIDYAIRSLARLVLDNEDSEKERLALSSINIKGKPKENKADVSYPGKRAKFVHSGGNWEVLDFGIGSPPRRELNFKSSIPGSFIREFSLFEFEDGTVRLQIEFAAEDKKKMGDYLANYNITITPYYYNFFNTYSTPMTRQLFDILVRNNEILEDSVKVIRSILENSK